MVLEPDVACKEDFDLGSFDNLNLVLSRAAGVSCQQVLVGLDQVFLIISFEDPLILRLNLEVAVPKGDLRVLECSQARFAKVGH